MVMMLYSKQPALKSKALTDLNRGLGKFRFDSIEKEERQEIFVALFAMIDKGCWERDHQVNMDAINLLLSMMQYHYSNFEQLDAKEHQEEFGMHVNSIIESLMAKLSTEDLRLKNHALDALTKISNYPLMNYAVQIDAVMRDSGTGDQRHLVAKLTLL